jgi:hypothetical protein
MTVCKSVNMYYGTDGKTSTCTTKAGRLDVVDGCGLDKLSVDNSRYLREWGGLLDALHA